MTTKIKKRMAKIMAGVTLFTIALTGTGLEALAAPATTSSSVNFRTGPSSSYSLIRNLPSGTALDVISHNSTWSKVKTGGKIGYLSNRYIKFITTGTTTGRVNMRSKGSASASLITRIPAGETVKVLAGPVSNWYKVLWNGNTGYINANYVTIKTNGTAVDNVVKTAVEEYPGYTKMTWTFTFYTDLPVENGGWTITAMGTKLRYGVLASNYWPLRSKVILPGWGDFTIEDRGGSSFDSKYRLDMCISRKSGESNSEYLRRVNNMGVKKITGYIKSSR